MFGIFAFMREPQLVKPVVFSYWSNIDNHFSWHGSNHCTNQLDL